MKTEIKSASNYSTIIMKKELKSRMDSKIKDLGFKLSYSALIEYLLCADEKIKPINENQG